MTKPSARIENWSKFGQRLCGDVYGHPSFTDGAPVYTSTIVAETETTVETRNTVYTLGAPFDPTRPLGSIKVNVEEEN